MRSLGRLFLLISMCAACAGDGRPPGDPALPPSGMPPGTSPDAAPGTSPDAAPGTPPATGPDAGLPVPPTPDDNPDLRFLTAPPGPPCAPEVADHFVPIGGYSGGIDGTGNCGPASPNCPTDYVAGNTGAPCSSDSECTGLNPVCLRGDKYPGGSCAATGCELGSNFGCPAGDTCINGNSQTYCLQGCGLDQSGCFLGCSREGYSCFNTESDSLGMCLGAEGTRQCDPRASARCTQPTFGDGICVQTSWDDQTVGRCFETCDPLLQDCVTDGQGCYVLVEYSGFPVCFESWGFPEGAFCERMTQCAEGLRCACDEDRSPCNGPHHCRRYCASNGSTICPSGTSCRPLTEGSRWGSCQP